MYMIHFQKQIRQVNKIKPKKKKKMKNNVPLKKPLVSFMNALCDRHNYDTLIHKHIILSFGDISPSND